MFKLRKYEREQSSKELCNRTIVLFKDFDKLPKEDQLKIERLLLLEHLQLFLEKDNIKVLIFLFFKILLFSKRSNSDALKHY